MRAMIGCAGLAVILLSACSRELVKDEIAIDKYHQANGLFEEGKYADCIPLYEYAIRWRDQILDAYIKLAVCYGRIDRPENAVAVLEKLRKVDRLHVPGMRALARAYEKIGNLGGAIEMQKGILDENANDTEAQKELFRLRKESGG